MTKKEKCFINGVTVRRHKLITRACLYINSVQTFQSAIRCVLRKHEIVFNILHRNFWDFIQDMFRRC